MSDVSFALQCLPTQLSAILGFQIGLLLQCTLVSVFVCLFVLGKVSVIKNVLERCLLGIKRMKTPQKGPLILTAKQTDNADLMLLWKICLRFFSAARCQCSLHRELLRAEVRAGILEKIEKMHICWCYLPAGLWSQVRQRCKLLVMHHEGILWCL